MDEQIVNEFLTEIAENTMYAKKFFEFYLKVDSSDKSLKTLKQEAKERLMNEKKIDPVAFRRFLPMVQPDVGNVSNDSPEMKDWVSLEGSIKRFLDNLQNNKLRK